MGVKVLGFCSAKRELDGSASQNADSLTKISVKSLIILLYG
jgi:hypothetical protein